MEMPKEIFLKDYKLPDYYFDTVYTFTFLNWIKSPTFLNWVFNFESGDLGQ